MLKTRFFRKTLNLVFAVATISFIILIQTTDAHSVSAQSKPPVTTEGLKSNSRRKNKTSSVNGFSSLNFFTGFLL